VARIPKLPREEKGFTLIEMVVAMGILLVGMTSILALLAFGLAVHRTSAKKAETALVVEGIVHRLPQLVFPKDPDKPARSLGSRPVPGHPGLVYSVEVEPNQESPGEYLAQIRLQWKEKGRFRTVEFHSVLIREENFVEVMRDRWSKEQ